MQKVRLYIFLLALGFILSAAGLSVVLGTMDPAAIWSQALFYFLLLISSFFLFMLSGVYLRRLMGQSELYNHYFKVSARQAVWLALVLAGCMVLLSLDLFSWINAGLLVGAVVFFEFYLASRK